MGVAIDALKQPGHKSCEARRGEETEDDSLCKGNDARDAKHIAIWLR